MIEAVPHTNEDNSNNPKDGAISPIIKDSSTLQKPSLVMKKNITMTPASHPISPPPSPRPPVHNKKKRVRIAENLNENYPLPPRNHNHKLHTIQKCKNEKQDEDHSEDLLWYTSYDYLRFAEDACADTITLLNNGPVLYDWVRVYFALRMTESSSVSQINYDALDRLSMPALACGLHERPVDAMENDFQVRRRHLLLQIQRLQAHHHHSDSKMSKEDSTRSTLSTSSSFSSSSAASSTEEDSDESNTTTTTLSRLIRDTSRGCSQAACAYARIVAYVLAREVLQE